MKVKRCLTPHDIGRNAIRTANATLALSTDFQLGGGISGGSTAIVALPGSLEHEGFRER